ncbi:hypothetical protein ACROYT_G003882 [Oculina patagonica]
MWKTIRSCISKKSASAKSFCKDDKTIANKFNQFFTSVGKTILEKIESFADECGYTPSHASFVPIQYPPSEQFTFRDVEYCEVERVVKSLANNKAPGTDKIPSRVIKESAPVIIPSITSIINSSFNCGVFPSVWKTAEVCEKIALDQLTPYLTEKQRLASNQSGNKKWHSTETSLISSTDAILRAIDQTKVTAVVYLDMSKAFDSIKHKILKKKLKNIGLSSSALTWFSSYLSIRSQVVRINSTLSDALTVTCGVPQGSVLGALLFSIYVNDLPATSESCSTECYVDDTKLLLSFKVGDADEAKDTIQKDLHLIRNWCFDNCLLLNPEKTKLMIFGSRPMIRRLSDFKLSLLGKELLPSESIKDLGVTFDPTLSFENHILATVSSLDQVVLRKEKGESSTLEITRRISQEELEKSKREVVMLVQKVAFPQEVKDLKAGRQVKVSSNIVKLKPVIMSDGVLRVGGRISNASISPEAMNPMILPKNHHITTILIRYVHERNGHCGVEKVLVLLREQFWVVKGRAAVKEVIGRCISCKKRMAPRMSQEMAELPKIRLTPYKPPFTYSGVDYFGPFYVKRGRGKGHVKELRSDNGTNFVGAEREIKEAIERIDIERVDGELMQRGCKWVFHPPGACYMSGVWERLVKSVKRSLKAILGKELINEEVL